MLKLHKMDGPVPLVGAGGAGRRGAYAAGRLVCHAPATTSRVDAGVSAWMRPALSSSDSLTCPGTISFGPNHIPRALAKGVHERHHFPRLHWRLGSNVCGHIRQLTSGHADVIAWLEEREPIAFLECR